MENLRELLTQNNVAENQITKVLAAYHLLEKVSWSSSTLKDIVFESLKLPGAPSKIISELCNALSIAFDYKLSEEQFKAILRRFNNYKNLSRSIHKELIKQFTDIQMKPLNGVLREINQLNENKNFKVEVLRSKFVSVKSYMASQCSASSKPIQSCDLSDIKSWLKDVARKLVPPSEFEKLAYIWRAMELTSGHKIRDVQILSVLMLYYPGANKIAQIDTGEGKTIIIAMLTILLCMDGHKVDIGKK